MEMDITAVLEYEHDAAVEEIGMTNQNLMLEIGRSNLLIHYVISEIQASLTAVSMQSR